VPHPRGLATAMTADPIADVIDLLDGRPFEGMRVGELDDDEWALLCGQLARVEMRRLSWWLDELRPELDA
jgi:hypothetical protein